jgi:hypothetical protein
MTTRVFCAHCGQNVKVTEDYNTLAAEHEKDAEVIDTWRDLFNEAVAENEKLREELAYWKTKAIEANGALGALRAAGNPFGWQQDKPGGSVSADYRKLVDGLDKFKPTP